MVQVRPYELNDKEAVAAVILPIQQLEFGIPISLEAQPDLSHITTFYQRGNGNFWVAVVDGSAVGTIGLLDIGNREAALRKMFVAAAYRGREHGVAQRLLDQLLAWCAQRGLSRIFLGTTAMFLAAHRFYEKNGFTEIQRADLPASFPVMSVDTRFYWLSIAPRAA